MKQSKVVAVTGTKGKTTVVTVLAEVLRALTKKDTIHVTTTGHFVNGERRSTLDESLATWGLVPSVCPGRYLYESLSFKERGVAVLESSLGSSSINGMGYSWHEVGIFLNVFKDHIGNSSRIKSQADILKAKKFIFTRIRRHEGWGVYNADDALICSAVPDIDPSVRLVSFGLADVAASERHVFVKDGMVTYRTADKRLVSVVALADVSWTFQGLYEPSVYNLLAVVAGVIAFHEGNLPHVLSEILTKIKLDPYGGRLTLLRNKEGVRILADYAHEEQSLCAVGELARALAGDGGQVIGVVRLAYDRTEQHIAETAKGIAKSFDRFVVYDKIDGYYRLPNTQLQSKLFTQEVGKVSELLADQLSANGAAKVDRILREDEAITFAAKEARAGDVVVHIVNDDITRSVNWLREYFGADFV